MFKILYGREDGTTIDHPTFDTLKNALLDLAHETVNSEIMYATILHQIAVGKRHVILKWDRDGLHHVDVIGSIEILGTEKFIGGSLTEAS